ncbi:MAG TPA: ABC transporter permease subunit [candidate division Zixibacteria bacterium]|nr:ABC transporter permease subunit [candidate division Zixibacteria bacterium]
MTTVPPGQPHHATVPPWRDVRVLGIASQVAVLVVVAAGLGLLTSNLLTNMAARNLTFDYGFVGARAGFEIGDSPVPYSADDTYAQAFLVGILNTVLVAVVGIILATILGVIVGVARLSPNWLLARVAAGYVEVIRNTPLLLQLFVIYFVVLFQLPSVQESIALPGSIFLNQRGLFVPSPQRAPTFLPWLTIVAVVLLLAIVGRVIGPRLERGGRRLPPLGRIGLLVALVVAVVAWVLLPEAPVQFEVPVAGRFNFTGGLELSTGFTALLLGLVIYTAAFIAEVVRGGIQAVRRGQVEAARALGLSERDTLRLVVFPQALRIIVPPLTSQYLNLTKNSSLAIAVGYPDLFKVGTTMANQTGAPVSVIALVMGTYLAISLITSALMNLYNRRVQVLER